MELNPQQEKAVRHKGGPLLIVAGAGSGKTRTLTARLTHLIQEGIPPHRIVAITFTNKAAGEMRSRITSNLELRTANNNKVLSSQFGVMSPYIGTFHSFGAKILREQASVLGRTIGYSIFDTDDSLAAIKTVMEAVGLSKDRHPPAMLLGLFSKIKSELLDPGDVLDEREREAFTAYEQFLTRNNAFDFDDLIEKVVALFERHPDMLKQYQTRYTHVLVDEYQDVNTAQYRFVKLLAGAHRNVSVVGDDAQAIYGWRSADYRNFLNFEKDWRDATVIFLDQNYRSSGNIIAAASALITHNKFQKPKHLWTENEAGELIQIVKADEQDEEAEFICEQINQFMSYAPTAVGATVHELKSLKTVAQRDSSTQSASRRSNASTIAILYRTNAQSRAIEQALIAYNIPYHIFGGLKFYERKEIKDIVAGLRVAANPRDEVSRERLMKTLPVGAARHLIALLPEKGSTLTVPELISFFLHEGDYFGYLAKKFRNVPERKENIEELIAFASTFTNLQDFLERVTLLQSADQPAKQSGQFMSYAPQRGATVRELNSSTVASETSVTVAKRNSPLHQLPVQLMTIHLAKGLEFDRVYIAGASEGLLPHFRSLASAEELEEERRLMYVAMTRARKHLAITFTHIPSRFLYEIPGNLTSFTDLTGRSEELPDEEEAWLE